MTTTMTLNLDQPMFVPRGTQVITTDPLVVELADYDYTPFSNPLAPAFDLLADRLHPDGSIDRDVPCTSLPGRSTIERIT
ncbi:DUF7233 domain-containing protein [Mycolicibacterium goodii]|uniref:DUF7233 domain-containing protein n=1 Tax=Mycolicibacterium goodii TaxID=134601 RepID=UPI001BDBBEA2|nr:hypothetical protein [Mycolicibacterium goodii]MBU8833590.1 hypothetical protein [Mycolicibacterium goodii]